MTSLPSHTIVPTATEFGRFTAGVFADWSTEALLTRSLCGTAGAGSRGPTCGSTPR